MKPLPIDPELMAQIVGDIIEVIEVAVAREDDVHNSTLHPDCPLEDAKDE